MQPMGVLEILPLDKDPALSLISNVCLLDLKWMGVEGPTKPQKTGLVLSLVLETSLNDCSLETNLALEMAELIKCIGYFLATNISLSSVNLKSFDSVSLHVLIMRNPREYGMFEITSVGWQLFVNKY